MTVSSQTNNATFVGNGVTTVFPLPFRFFANGDVFAYFIDTTTCASTPMALGTDYTLAGAAEPEVNGNAVSVLTTTVPLANGRGLYVERIMQEVQSTEIVNQGEFFASTHEDVFDRLTMLIQQANANSQGAIRVAIGDPEPSRLVPAAQRVGKLLSFDSLGSPIVVAPESGSATDLALILADAADPLKGVAVIGRGAQVVSSITELRGLIKTSASKSAFVTGYYSAGDGGGGPYYLDDADVVSADNGGTVIVANDGGRWKLAHTGSVSFKQFGAKGNGTGDDAPFIQKCFDYLLPIGGKALVTAGKYLIGSTVTIDMRTTTDYQQNIGVHIHGDGSSCTELRWTANNANPVIKILGDKVTAPLTQNNISGFKITSANAFVGTGIKYDGGAYNHINDVTCYGLAIGFDLVDFLSSLLTRCVFLLCNQGIVAARLTYSRPNAITLLQCVFGSCKSEGARITNGSGFNMVGGSVENCGNNTTWGLGIFINQPGLEGGNAANFEGVYFEGNAQRADIYITAHPAAPTFASTVTVNGCVFNRAIPTNYVVNNIRLDSGVSGDAPIILNVTGCGFKGFNSYAPNAAHKYILTTGSGQSRLVQIGNYYQSAIERPAQVESVPFAQASFNGATGVLRKSDNIASCVRNSVGSYTLNFIEPGTGDFIYSFGSVSTPGATFVSAVSAYLVTVVFTDLAGTPVDPSILSVTIHQ